MYLIQWKNSVGAEYVTLKKTILSIFIFLHTTEQWHDKNCLCLPITVHTIPLNTGLFTTYCIIIVNLIYCTKCRINRIYIKTLFEFYKVSRNGWCFFIRLRTTWTDHQKLYILTLLYCLFLYAKNSVGAEYVTLKKTILSIFIFLHTTEQTRYNIM
jgi:hypothetical protein